MRGATRMLFSAVAISKHFDPRTPCGVRLRERETSKDAKNDFDPRTPCGVRPPVQYGNSQN